MRHKHYIVALLTMLFTVSCGRPSLNPHTGQPVDEITVVIPRKRCFKKWNGVTKGQKTGNPIEFHRRNLAC